MYKRFPTYIKKEINTNFYFGDTRQVEKEIITTSLWHPYINKIFTLRIHFAKIKYNVSLPKEISKGIIMPWWSSNYSEIDNLFIQKEVIESNADIKQELELYSRKNSTSYMFIEVFHKKEAVPPYFAFRFFTELLSFELFSINKQNYKAFKDILNTKFIDLMAENVLPSSFINDFKHIAQSFGKIIEDYDVIIDMRTDYFINNLKKDLNSFNKKILNETENETLSRLFIVPYAFFLITSEQNKIFKVCENCGDIINYKNNKKYCSLVLEGKDCAKKASNKRFYAKKTKKNKPY
ncbi:MAG: hypothetical protein PHX18_05255 [Candidatus Gastranaerophilales bacterium]|nr:hypothetical protein [Candidatus Gastranaerophilales bacterium]